MVCSRSGKPSATWLIAAFRFEEAKMSVTLSEVKRAARAHRAPLAGESAGYLVLAIADQVLKAPRLVQSGDIQLSEDGALRLASGHASSDADAELSLRRALDQLLLVASSGSAALTRASRRTEPLGLSSLVRELEAALIPVNRSAARRALARVHRETARALESGSLPEEEEPRAPEPVAPTAGALPFALAAAMPPLTFAVATSAPTLAVATSAPTLAVATSAPAVVAVTPAPAVVAVTPAPTLAVATPAPTLAVATPAPTLVDAMPALLAAAATPVPPAVAMLAPLPTAGTPAPLPAEPQHIAELRGPSPGPELESEEEHDLETPVLTVPVLPMAMESHLNGVISALCEQLPLPPQFVETDALAPSLTVRAVTTPAPVPVAAAEPEPEFLLDIDVEFETDAVDSSAAPTVMRAVQVEPVPISMRSASCDLPASEMPPEALTRPEPVVLRRTLRPLLESLSKALGESEPLPPTLEPLPQVLIASEALPPMLELLPHELLESEALPPTLELLPHELLESEALPSTLELLPHELLESEALPPSLEPLPQAPIVSEVSAPSLEPLPQAPIVSEVSAPSLEPLSQAPIVSETLPWTLDLMPHELIASEALPPTLELLPHELLESEALPQTPTFGSLASELPILPPEQIAEMSLVAQILHSAQLREDRTERMPEVPPLSPGVAIVASKKSDVSELLSSFQVSEPSASSGLCRAIKEMADLELTPGPFAALIRER
jgi:hypothetical protein